MSTHRAFVALGSNEGDSPARLAEALEALEAGGERVAAVSRSVWSPYVGSEGPAAADVLNAVCELRTARGAEALLERLHAIEAQAQRVRDGRPERALDLDLLVHGDAARSGAAPILPHPRALERAFVLAPWEEIAPDLLVPGTHATVVEHAARLRARRPEQFEALGPAMATPLPALARAPEVVPDREALRRWRAGAPGVVGVVPTMGALHAGHATLVRRARAECDVVLATLFVNPLQFGPGEDLARYPRTFDADLRVLAANGADAVYAPSAQDLYPEGFATFVEPRGAAEGLEGAARDGHFRGVATVVTKLWLRTRPDRAYFGRKDAQQVAVIAQIVRDLDLDGTVVVCPTVRDEDGLALSSRNRYLSAADRARALALSRTLEAVALEAARGQDDAGALAATARGRLRDAAVEVEYVAVVDPKSMKPLAHIEGPALAVAAVRVAGTRLLDNRWIAAPLPVAAP